MLRRQRNARVLLAEVSGFDLANRQVILRDGTLAYDSLIVATGARHHYFGHPEWEKDAPGLKTIEDATEIRRRVLLAFEMAERCTDPAQQKEWLTFVVVGGGPTGVELAGAVAELAQHTLRNNFRAINPANATVLLVEGIDRVLTTYPRDLSHKAERALDRIGVTVRTGTSLTEVRHDQVVLRTGTKTEVLPTHTILWGAGVQGSPLAQCPGASDGSGAGPLGAGPGPADLTLPGHPEVFAIGDMAAYLHQTGTPLPGVAQVAMQQAKYVADLIQRRLKGKPAGPVCLQGHGQHGDHRPIGRGGGPGLGAVLRFAGLAGLAVRPHPVHHHLREPHPGDVPVGVELRHPRPLRPADHRRQGDPSSAGFVHGGRALRCRADADDNAQADQGVAHGVDPSGYDTRGIPGAGRDLPAHDAGTPL